MRHLLTIALVICFSGGYSDSYANSTSERPERGKAPITFERRENLGYVVRFEKLPHPFGGFLCGLVSVDHKDLSKFTEAQLKELLYGPVGSTFEVEIISPDGKSKTETVTRELRESVINKPMGEYNGLALRRYDNRAPRASSGSSVADSLDIDARATQNLLVQTVGEWPKEATADNLSPMMFSAAIVNYEMGDIAAGDKYLELSEKEYVPGQRWFPFENRQLGKALNVLISVGRIDAAQKAVRNVVEGGTLHIFQADDLYPTLARAQMKNDTKAAVATVEKYLQVTKSGAGGVFYSRTWIADIFKQAGEYQRAEEIYTELIRNAPAYDKRWENLHSLAGYVFERSLLQSKLGDKSAAVTGLQEIISKLKNNLPDTQLAIIEKMPGVFPKVSDLEIALEAAKDGRQFPQSPNDASVELPFPDIRACHEAIKKNDKENVTRLVHSFLEQYHGSVPQAQAALERQNLYCCILELGREISDHGWLNLSNEVLRRLQKEAYGKDANMLAKCFLHAELIYNASKEKKNSEAEWNAFEGDYHCTSQQRDDSTWQDCAWSERLRRLAVVLYYAGEVKRAEYFINEALSRSGEEAGPSASITDYGGSVGEKTMMLLDAACIAAKQGRFDKAETYWVTVSGLPALSQDGYLDTVIELSSIYLKANKQDRAIAMLESVRSKPITIRTYQLNNGVTALDLYLAKILFDSGKVTEAKQIADAAAAKMPQRLYWPQCLLVAQCDEAAGDYAQAAKIYANKPWTSSPIIFTDGDATPWIEKGLKLADKSPGFDKAALAKICTDLAEHKGYQHPDETYSLYKRALELTPQTDPKKSVLMTKLAQLETSRQARTGSDGTKPVEPTTTANNPLKMREEAAALAERNHHPNARSLWTQLAENEASQDLVTKALKDEHHAMDLYTAKDAMNHEGILGYRGGITNMLVYKGHKDEAERLLVEAVARTKAVGGPGSVATQAQLTDLFCFYVQQGRKPMAFHILDQILQFNLKSGETISQSLMRSHCGPGWPQPADAAEVLSKVFQAVLQMKPKDLEFSRVVFERILSAQRSQLPKDDERLLGTTAQLGDTYFELGKYADADKYYSEAYALSTRYHAGEFAVRLAGKNYLANLRKIGKESEADRLSNMDWEGAIPTKQR